MAHPLDTDLRDPFGADGQEPTKKVTTQDAVALAFERRHATRYRFNSTSGDWLKFNGATWQEDETKLVRHDIRDECRRAGRKFQSAQTVKGVEFLCQAAPQFAITHNQLDSDTFLLGTPRGTVDLRTGEMRRPCPLDLITRSTAVAPEYRDPVVWKRFVSEATGGDPEFVRFLQQLVGYTLTGDVSAQCLFFFFGDGGTGKSTFVNTTTELLGTYAATAAMDTFVASKQDRHSTELAMLAGRRLVAANETEQGREWAAARIKSLSGGDPITARFMRQDFFTYSPTFKLVFVGNFAPRLEVVDEAMRRRFHVVPFDVKPQKKDEGLRQKLSAELPAILHWAIEGCLDWKANGLVIPQRVRDATGVYFEQQDLFTQWLEEKVSRADYKARTTKDAALRSWNLFRQSAGERPEGARELSQKLVRSGFKEGRSSDHGNRVRVWLGMEVADV